MIIDPPSAVVMVRPHAFRVNDVTAADNAYQVEGEADAKAAYEEVTAAADALRRAGVTVHLFEDSGSDTPDSVFPNNWFTTHEDGRVLLYPMCAPNRRGERRDDIIKALKTHYRVDEVVDLSANEERGRFLEGTGSMVLDRAARIAYAALSSRTNEALLEEVCTFLGYTPLAFQATDRAGLPVYHTNVIMTLGTGYALVAADMIRTGHDAVLNSLEAGGREVIALDEAQVADFAGNAFEVAGKEGRVLALSARANKVFSSTQRATLERHASLLPIDIPTIERSGGSVRCMLAGVHLPPIR